MNKEFNKKYDYLTILLIIICLSYFIHLLLLVFAPNSHQWSIIFLEGQDFLADFFNVVRFTSNKDVYMNPIGKGYTCYLPLSYFLLYPFITVVDYTELSLKDCWSNPQALMSALFYTIISLTLFFHALLCLFKKYNIRKILIIPLILSNIFIFTIERGNWIIVTAACVYYFLAFFESEDKKLKYFAAICLVIAAVLKIYPVILGILYIQRKDYKIIFFCFIIGFLFTILPFFAFKSGLKAIPTFLETLSWNSKIYSIDKNPKFGLPYLVYWFGRVLEKYFSAPTGTSDILKNVSSLFIRIYCIYAIFLSFKTKCFYSKLLLLIMVALYFPAHSEYYCGLYLFPVILLFFSNEKTINSVEKKITLIFFIILLQNIQIDFNGRFNITRIFVDVITLLFFIYQTINITINSFKMKSTGEKKCQ